jgi:hypothetical protein
VRRLASFERARTCHVAVEQLGLGRAVIYGAAHMLDFRGVLLRRRCIHSAEEDMAVAWQETGSALTLGIFRGEPRRGSESTGDEPPLSPEERAEQKAWLEAGPQRDRAVVDQKGRDTV